MNIKKNLLAAVAIAGAATVAYAYDLGQSTLGEESYSAAVTQPVSYFDESEGSQSASNQLTWFFPDGSIAYDDRDKDGSVLWIHSDGLVVRDKGLGEITWWQTDGTRIEQSAPTVATWYFPDGTVLSDNTAPGLVAFHYPDGSVTYQESTG
jgi:hypothetical protein